MSTPNTDTHPTFIQQACLKVCGFSNLYNKLERDISLSGRSLSTLKNHSRHMAQIALYYNQLPTELDEDQVRDYLSDDAEIKLTSLLKALSNMPSMAYAYSTGLPAEMTGPSACLPSLKNTNCQRFSVSRKSKHS